MSAKQAAKDWGGIFTGLAALVGVLLTHYSATQEGDAAKYKAATAAAKADKAYELLVERVNRLDTESAATSEAIADIREALGELRGALSARARLQLKSEAYIPRRLHEPKLEKLPKALPPLAPEDIQQHVDK